MQGTAPLAGVRVLDASRVLAGPFCGMILGDLGAEVIKIERPRQGDETREWGPPFHGDLSAYFLSCNRNKRAITLDMSQPQGIALAHRLAQCCDIVLTNFLPKTASKLGLDAATLHGVNPRLVVANISGYGQTGPWAAMPGYDFAIQAQSGLMSITGPADGPPSKVGVAITDIASGLYTAIGVLACLHARQTSGHGYALDMALLDCAVAIQANVAQAFLTSGAVPPRQGNAHLQIVPYQLFATADSHLVLAVGNDGQWQRFCTAAGRPDLAAQEQYRTNPDRVRHRAALIPIVAAIMAERTTRDWESVLTNADVPHAAVMDYAQLFSHPQALARGLKVTVTDPAGQPVDLVNSPFRVGGAELPVPRMPPTLGADTHAVLTELLGMSDEAIAAFRRAGTI
jgi:crotonobetainyl-CoA:carnitine CoA-transferase CaiB-like acyl-CoA transferase